MKIILSIDQSTSGTKGLAWDMNGKLLARADVPHRQITNETGWIEHDPMEIVDNTIKAAKTAIDAVGAEPEDVAAIGITNQRETAVCWNRATGVPLHNAIVWQCARAKDITGSISDAGLAHVVMERTGLPLSPYFSAAKFGWMVKHIPEVAAAKRSGALCCGTIDSWLMFKLARVFKTDYSNASRTQLLNLRRLAWDEELVDAFGLDLACLPEICMSDSLFGYTDLYGLLPKAMPIHCAMGDSHAALFGNQCWSPYSAKATFGTGSSVMLNVGAKCPAPAGGIVASLAWGVGGAVEYVLEGNINYTGAVIKWLAEDAGMLSDPRCAGDISQTVADTGGVYLVPAFSGLGAPYYNDDARAAFVGMSRATKNAHLVRAAEECIAYQIRDVIEAIDKCSGKPMPLLRVDGGPTRDAFLMRFLADILNVPVEINETEELSGMGAAFCAAAGAGLACRDALFAGQTRRRVMPSMDDSERDRLYSGWRKAVRMISG